MINPFRIRSFLFVPAIKQHYFDNLFNLSGEKKPDGIIFDLEDSVAGDSKNSARKLLEELFNDSEKAHFLKENYVICVRVNKIGTSWFKDDCKLIQKIKPHFLMLAKVETAKEIHTARKVSRNIQLIVAIETLRGLHNADLILSQLTSFDVVVAGYEDPSAELLIERPSDLAQLNPLSFFFMQCLFAVRRHKLVMIDAPSRKFADTKALSEFKKECELTNSYRLSGKMAIHPEQVSIINQCFDKQDLIKESAKIIGEFDSLTDGSSVLTDKHKEMIDTPSYKLSKEILRLWNQR